MARFNEILVGRFNRALQKYTAIKGEPPAPQLSSEIQPVFDIPLLEDTHYLFSWNRFAAVVSVAAGGAGNFSQIKLRNPANSNVIALVERAFIVQPNIAQLYVLANEAGQADLTGGTPTARRLDPRIIQASTCIFSQGVLVGVPATSLVIWEGQAFVGGQPPTMEALQMNQRLPLLPGDDYTFSCLTANSGFVGGFHWMERFLEDSERT